MTKDERLTDEEWLRRYDAHITDLGEFEGSYSSATGEKETLDQFRGIGSEFDDAPEDAADEELSNWN